jgi:hypothetical protein
MALFAAKFKVGQASRTFCAGIAVAGKWIVSPRTAG